MTWDMAPECVSAVALIIIWIYSRKGNPIPSLKNGLFQICFFFTLCSMLSNIISTILIYTLIPGTLLLTWVCNMIYFISTPLMGMVYFFYSLATVYEDHPRLKHYFWLTAIPGMLYELLILVNPWTRSVFNITIENGYQQGPLIMSTYYVFYFYCIACVVLVLVQGKRVSTPIKMILFTYPMVAVIVILIQMAYPTIVLSGSAATCAMLLIYLYLQNKQLSIDHLTRIPNRQEFLKMLEIKLKRETQFQILVLSLREFKTVNDHFGQHVGDGLLKAVSDFLRKDLMLREGTLYRYSGDEFAIIMRGNQEQESNQLMEQILTRMQQPWEVNGYTCLLSAVIGVVRYPDIDGELENLINGIECSVSLAKQDSYNQLFCICTPELLEQARRKQKIAAALRKGLKEDHFLLFYQPIWEVENKRFCKAEALLRLQDPVLGFLSPNEFIPIAEESGLIIEITYVVLEKVCAFVRKLLDQGVEFDGINVNFSALQFTCSDLIEKMKGIIERYEIPYSKIIVEITESTLSENVSMVTDYMNQMHELGILLGLDDFGTGYSNLTAVLGLPIDTVKLDKSLVWSSMSNDRFSIVMKNFSRAFRELGMTVLAEGVETEEQSRFVEACGCSYIQGFLYAKPMPQEDFEALMQTQTNDVFVKI